jgi:hypothetical protein
MQRTCVCPGPSDQMAGLWLPCCWIGRRHPRWCPHIQLSRSFTQLFHLIILWGIPKPVDRFHRGEFENNDTPAVMGALQHIDLDPARHDIVASESLSEWADSCSVFGPALLAGNIDLHGQISRHLFLLLLQWRLPACKPTKSQLPLRDVRGRHRCLGLRPRQEGRNGGEGYLPRDGGRRFRESRAIPELSVRPS